MNVVAPLAKMRPREAAEYLQVAVSTLAKMRARKIGPRYARATTRLIIYDRDDLDTWLASCRNDAGQDV